MIFALGSAVKFSFIVFLPIHPIPATRPVIVAASRIDFTSLLSDIVLCIFKMFKSFLFILIFILINRQPHRIQDPAKASNKIESVHCVYI